MAKVLHLPDGDKEIATSEEETAEKTALAQKEAQFRKWIEQAAPYEASFVQWSDIGSDEDAQRVMDMVAEFATAFVTARVLHHSASSGTPPNALGISLQVVTFDENENPLEEIEVDLTKPKE